MTIDFVHGPRGGLLQAVRETLRPHSELLICVAFATEAGVHMVSRELAVAARTARPRMVVTTALSTTRAALDIATRARCDVRVHNARSRSTYHPKVYLSRDADGIRGFIGSANLTGGLATNVEAGLRLDSGHGAAALEDAWRWAETLWAHDHTRPWAPEAASPRSEVLRPVLRRLIANAVADDSTFRTLSRDRPNRVSDITADSVYVTTERSASEGQGPQPVPAWMLNLAWDTLHAEGKLTNQRLLNELRVHRSSFVLALLARLRGVEPLPGRRTGVRLVDD